LRNKTGAKRQTTSNSGNRLLPSQAAR
jgi:hypothetical protein